MNQGTQPVGGDLSSTNTSSITIKSLLEAGAHFGHQTQRWNPKMLQYIYTERNGVHVINLDITLKLWERARKYIVDTTSMGGSVLMVGTKQQAREIIRTEAERCSTYYVTSRWLGGTLSNFQTIKNSIDRMKKLEDFLAQAEVPDSKVRLNKKEKLDYSRQLGKLLASLGGIRGMKKLPNLLFIVDVTKESIAVAEARRLHIPVVALVDTNANPECVGIPIPSNDDSTRTIRLFTSAVADAILQGRAEYEARRPKEDKIETEESNGVSEHPPAEGEVQAAPALV